MARRIKRKKLNKKYSRKLFTRTAKRVNRKNNIGTVMRGGTRL